MPDGLQAEVVSHIRVRVRPRAGRSEVVGYRDGVLEVRLAALPVRGQANRALLELLSGVLGVARSRLRLEKGARGRLKLLAVEGLSEEEVRARLEG